MLEIRTIKLRDEKAYRDFQALLAEEGNPFIQVKQLEAGQFAAFVERSKRQETETDNPDWSTSTNYYAFKDGQIAGRVGCRWELDKGDLAMVGGHIGYVTSPAFRRQGIMTELLAFALERYRERGILEVLITANKDNLASRKTIEKAGGQLENIITLENDQELARYWIQL
ncbi:GNAT family N-acetyltransferase [Streptococcus merionis]|uniref:GNAT family N-acetyltransferase n=1 Tax=Streptococcus merionis TaxID=400065 RepID=UPI00351553B8